MNMIIFNNINQTILIIEKDHSNDFIVKVKVNLKLILFNIIFNY